MSLHDRIDATNRDEAYRFVVFCAEEARQDFDEICAEASKAEPDPDRILAALESETRNATKIRVQLVRLAHRVPGAR